MKANEKKKDVKVNNAKNTNSKGKVKKTKKQGYLKALKLELSKVVWPKKNEVLKYTIATIGFIIILVIFFLLLNLLLSVVKGMFA